MAGILRDRRKCLEHSLALDAQVPRYVRLTYAQMDLTALGNRIAALLMERIQVPDDVRINRELRFPTQFIPGESSALCPK